MTDDNNNETVTELPYEQSEKQLPVGNQSPVTDKHSRVVDDEYSLVIVEQSSVPDKQPPVAMQLPVTDDHSPICVEDMQSPIADNQVPITEQLPVTDSQLMIIQELPVGDPVEEKQSPVAKQLPVTDSQLPIAEELPTGDQQLPGGDNQASVAKQLSIADKQLSIVEELSAEQELPVGEKQSPLRVVDISCDVDHEQLPHHSEDEMEYLAMEVEHSGDITPSEHGQVVDRSSEDPLNSAASRSEMASTESSPRYINLIIHLYSLNCFICTCIRTFVHYMPAKFFIYECINFFSEHFLM